MTIIIMLYTMAYHILHVINPIIITSDTFIIPDIINSIPYAHTSFSSSVITSLDTKKSAITNATE